MNKNTSTAVHRIRTIMDMADTLCIGIIFYIFIPINELFNFAEKIVYKYV